MKIYSILIFNFLLLLQTANTQVNLSFQGNEVGDTWGFTTTGASNSALSQANANANKVSGSKSIVVGGNTGGGSCFDGGSGNGSTIENKITFLPINIATSNEQTRTLSFHWGSRFPICTGTGWDFGEDLTFTPFFDGIPQTPIIIAVGNNNSDFNIKDAAQKYAYTIPVCVNSFAFELTLPTNRRDELLFLDDVKLSTPTLNIPFSINLNLTGDASVCAGNISTISTNLFPGVSYEWSGLPAGASFTSVNNTTNSNSMTIDWGTTSTGTYQIKLKPRKVTCGIAVYGAEVSFQVMVNENPILTSSPATSICLGAETTLSVSGASTYIWANGLGTNNSITVSPTANTSYQVTGYNGSCSASETIIITVNQATIFAGNDATICQGSSITLAASGGSNYSWDQGVVNGVSFIPSSTKTYTVTSNGACSGTDQITITVSENPVVDFVSDVNTGCLPLNVQFTNLSTGNNSYQWNFADGTNSALTSPSHAFSTTGCKDISLIATSANGCATILTLDDFICVSYQPNAQFATDIDEINSESSTVEFTNLTTDASDFIWKFGDGNFSNEFSTTHTFDPFSLENQLVTLIATNSSGCIDSTSKIIYFRSFPSIYVPNAFTPNGDELNQIFIPKFGDGIDPTKYHLSIFNRWGGLVFETNDINFGWDGTFKGLPVQAGAYTWKLRYGIVEGIDQIERLGHVTILP